MSVDYRLLRNIFAGAKSRFQYLSDEQAFGQEEHWISPTEVAQQLAASGIVAGDCDDFASLCVMSARSQGLPARFVLCLTEASETHLVCEVDGWVLDNRQPDVTRRDDLDYVWCAVSGFKPGDPWHTIK